MKFRWLLNGKAQKYSQHKIIAVSKKLFDDPMQCLKNLKKNDAYIPSDGNVNVLLKIEKYDDEMPVEIYHRHPILDFSWGRAMDRSPFTQNFITIYQSSGRKFDNVKDCLDDLTAFEEQDNGDVVDCASCIVLFVNHKLFETEV